MSYPVGTAPDGAWQLGDGGRYGQSVEEDSVLGIVTNGAKTKAVAAQESHREHVRDRIDGAYAEIIEVDTKAGQALTDAEAATNAAAAAESSAASASDRASYWESEFVVASAAVVLGDNELLIGLCQNVPGGLSRNVTDMHVALKSQPNGLTFELKRWNALGTVADVLGTYTLAAGVTRANWAGLNFPMNSRERLYINVTSVTGSIAPVVFQVLLFGVME